MVDILELIKSRRNVKSFIPKFVSWELISRIIDAGRHAPSCGNIQNWKFIVFVQPEKKAELAKLCYEQYDIAQAGVLILVVVNTEKAERYYGERGENFYSVQNGAAAIQNMLLEAHSLGLGGSWIGAFDEEEVSQLAGLPEQVRPQAVVAIGYPKEIPPRPAKYPLETLIYFHSWRSKIRDSAKYMHDIATILSRKAGAAKAKITRIGNSVVDKGREKFSKKSEDNS